MSCIKINKDNIVGKIKPMHGVGQPPFLGTDYSYIKYLKEANIPYSRLHDVAGWFGGNLYVDVPNIFRDFNADENDASSYDFTFTDMLIAALKKNDCEPVYRLGVTIENFHHIKAYRIFPPSDMEKWARVCEHIIKHYNEGWADGFHYGIKYWEIWNEPDNGIDNTQNMMWHGTKEDYFNLYRVTSKHLKKCFGNSIKIGGYSNSGFYAVDDEDGIKSLASGLGLKELPPEWKNRIDYFVEFFDDFIEIVVKEQLPLDFFSHHSYADLKNTVRRQKYLEERLEKAGLSSVEIHLNEWNTNTRLDEKGKSVSSANTVAMMCVMQNMKMDMMCYYDARISPSPYGGMFNPMTLKPLCTYFGFKAFGKLYEMGQQIECLCNEKNIYALAATNGKKTGVLITNIGDDAVISTNIQNDAQGYLIDEENFLNETCVNATSFKLNKYQVIYFEF